MKIKLGAIGLLSALISLGGCRAAEVDASKAKYEGVGPTAKLDKKRDGPRSIEITIERGEKKTLPIYIIDKQGESDAE